MRAVGGALLSDVRSMLLLGAHPDDIELGCGATVLQLARRQPWLRVRWVVCSGTAERADEARASAIDFLDGIADVDIVVHGFTDSYFPAEYRELKQAIVDAGRDFDPDLIFTHQRDDLHQDHRLVAELTLNAFRDHLILGYEICKYDGDLGRPNIFAAADAQTVDDKVALLRKHFSSQRDRKWFDDEAFRSIMRLRGIECRADAGYAEAFYGPKVRLL